MNDGPSAAVTRSSAQTPIRSSGDAAARGPGAARYDWPLALTALGCAFASMLVLYWPGVTALVHIWLNSVTYAHGMMILPLALWLVWLRRRQLACLRPTPSPWGIAAVAALGALWFAGRIVDVTSVQTFVVVALLPALTIALLGTAVARRLLFPLCFLFFAWPVGNFLVPVLQDYTAWFSVLMLKLGGIPVYLEGHYISIPHGNFLVADVCSGIRYLIASVAVGSVYAYLMYRSMWRRLAFMGLALVLPVLANGARAWGIITIAHLTDMKHAVGVDHLIYGWVFFVFVLLLLFGLGSLFREPYQPPAAGAEAAAAPFALRSVAAPLLATALVLGAGPAIDSWLSSDGAGAAEALRLVPPVVPGWEGPLSAADEWQPDYAVADRTLHADYRRDGEPLALHVFQYLQHGRGSDLIRYDNRIPDETLWRRASEAERRVALPDGGEATVREVVMRGPEGRSRIVWYWYQVGGTPTTQPVAVKLLEAWARLRGDERGSLLVTLTGDYPLSAADVRARMAAFVAAAGMRVEFDAEDGT